MKSRKILYICSGVFNCVIGGIGCFFGLMFLALTKLVKKMFLQSGELVEEFVAEISATSKEYEYLLEATNEEVVNFMMKSVYIISIILIVLGLIWITFGVFNCLLSTRHYAVFGTRPVLKVLFVVGSWLLLTFNVANITTTIAVFKKDKNEDMKQPLYTSGNYN